MNYSKIKDLRVKNFRNIGDITLNFDESPIISLVGDNEAGKTSIIKAFAVCSLHTDQRYQVNYIRDGTQGFVIKLGLEDGSEILRLKTSDSNQYIVQKSDGDVWKTNKIDQGLPVQVKELMGMVEEPETKEFLQIRTYENQLLFVTTSASTNYKVMYDALKVENITKAIQLGSKEANSVKANIDKKDIAIESTLDNIRDIKIYNIEPVVNIKNQLELDIRSRRVYEGANREYNNLKILRDKIENISKASDLEEIQLDIAISISKANKLKNVTDRLEDRASKLRELPEEQDESIVVSLVNTLRNLSMIKTLKDRLHILIESESCEEVSNTDIKLAMQLYEVGKRVYSLTDIKNKLQCILKEEHELELKKPNLICPECGYEFGDEF